MPSGIGYDKLDVDDRLDRSRIISDYWDQANQGLADENLRFQENFRFYVGGDGQWNKEDLIALDEQKRPHLSLNKCMPYINIISGYQRKFRDALTVFPRRGGTANTASILTELGRHSMDSSRPSGDLVLSEAFLMSIIGAKWWTGWRDDFTYDPINGDIAPESVSYLDVLEDPIFLGYDIDENNPHNYCRFVFRTWWMEPDQVAELWPDKKDMINSFSSSTDETYAGSGNPFVNRQVTNSVNGDYSGTLSLKAGNTNITRWMVRRCYYKVWKTKYVLYNNQTKQRFDVDSDITKIKELVRVSNGVLQLIFHTVPELYQTTYLGDTELDHEKDPFNGIINYPLTRICPYWVDGHAMGMIDNLKDPQRELNKSRSQFLSHLNQSNNSGWLMEDGSVDETELDNFENSSKPGWVGTYKPGKPKPEKQTPALFSQGHIVAAQMSEKDFDTNTNINDAVTGNTTATESGKALETRRDQGLTTNQVIFDNFNLAQVALYGNLIERIRTPNKNGTMLYSEDEVQQIVQEHDLQTDENVADNMSEGRYGLKVGRSPTAETARTEEFDQLLAVYDRVPSVAQELGPIPIIEASNMSKKDELVQMIVEQRQQMIQQAIEAQQQGQQVG